MAHAIDARKLGLAPRYTARVLRNDFTETWHEDIVGLKAASDEEAAKWTSAWDAGDTRVANTFVGEVTGLIHAIRPAADILEDIVSQAERLLHAHNCRGTPLATSRLRSAKLCQVTTKLPIMAMSSCSRLWQWKT